MMKVNTNIPIFAILTIFIASNTLLYRYLNNGYFIDKKPETPERVVENVIFKLISDHESVLLERNNQILLEAEQLRNRKLTITDSAELKAIEEKLRALELESLNVQELVQNSENEKLAAAKRAASDRLQLTELMESNSRMGAQLEKINGEFDNYVETLQETLVSNSFSEKDINEISIAFRNQRGLNYLNDMVGNIQKNRSALSASYTEQLNSRSNEYHEGLKNIASLINDNKFIASFDDKGLIKSSESINKLKSSLNNYIVAKDRNSLNNLNSSLSRQEAELLKELELQLANLKSEEELKLQNALAKQLNDLEIRRLIDLQKAQDLTDKQLKEAAIDKANSLIELEDRLRKELNLDELEKRIRAELAVVEKPVEKSVEKMVEVVVPKPDKPIYTSWIHIPGIWESTATSLRYTGKKVDTIAWSRNTLTDNKVITFTGDYSGDGEFLFILYGNGRFKNWSDGIILSLTSIGKGKVLFNIIKNGLGDKSEVLFTNSYTIDSGINGDYYIEVASGKLTFDLNGSEIIKDYILDTELTGKFGFINREFSSREFNITNIKLFDIR